MTATGIAIGLGVCLAIALVQIASLHWRLGRAEKAVDFYRGVVVDKDMEIGRLRTRLGFTSKEGSK